MLMLQYLHPFPLTIFRNANSRPNQHLAKNIPEMQPHPSVNADCYVVAEGLMSCDGDGFATVADVPESQVNISYEDIMATLFVTGGSRQQGGSHLCPNRALAAFSVNFCPR
jgi:hypothetical protein